MIKHIRTEKAAVPPEPYCQGIISDGVLYSSGLLAIDPKTNKLVEGGIKEQTICACENIGAILESEGFSFADVIKVTIFLATMEDFAGFNEVYEKYFISKPARSCVGVGELLKGAKVEIEIIAKKS